MTRADSSRRPCAGALSYAFNPTSPLRDSIYVSLAFISASRKHRTFHIDGGTTVYHCKALTVRSPPQLLFRFSSTC